MRRIDRGLTRRGLLKAGGAGAVGAAALGATGGKPDGSNVVLIVIDTVRTDHVGAYGYRIPALKGTEAELRLREFLTVNPPGRLDDLGLEKDTTVLLLSDHGMTLGERGVIGKKPTNAFNEIYQVPYMIRDPAGRRAGETSGYFASTHGEDVPERPVFTASYANQVLAGDEDWFLIADNQGKSKRLFRRDDESNDVAGDNEDVVDRLWRTLISATGGPLPRLGAEGAIGL